jgi:hypothetical protein
MLSDQFCRRKAEECELHAAEVPDPRLAREWRWMADEWRLAFEPEADREAQPLEADS